MFEIDRMSVMRWGHTENRNALPLNIDVDCPSCGKSLVNSNLDFAQMYNQEIYHARVTCIGCEGRAHILMINWSPTKDRDSLNARFFIDPSPKPNLDLPTDVDFQTFSPRFVEVYRQAAEVDALNYDELAGMGYRKALEMLITDYLIVKYPDKRSEIEQAKLGQRIENFIDNPQLRRAAKHAAWLGNDETHYQRLHPDADIDDLRSFLQLTLDWISMEVKADSLDEANLARRKWGGKP